MRERGQESQWDPAEELLGYSADREVVNATVCAIILAYRRREKQFWNYYASAALTFSMASSISAVLL